GGGPGALPRPPRRPGGLPPPSAVAGARRRGPIAPGLDPPDDAGGGRGVMAACRQIGRCAGDDGEMRHLAELLRFLADHGWRPPSQSGTLLSGIWLRLADSVADHAIRRRLLIAGLETAEGSHEVRLIRRRLDALAGQSGPPP